MNSFNFIKRIDSILYIFDSSHQFKFFINIKRRNIIIMTFILSLMIELAQLTGLFFTYPGSYRLFDVDDIMMNTLGGFLGTVLANNINGIVPDIFRNKYIALDTVI